MDPKIFWCKIIIGLKKNSDQKETVKTHNFLEPIFFFTKKSLGLKFFWPHNFLEPWYFWTYNFCGPNNFFGTKKFLNPKHFLIQNFFYRPTSVLDQNFFFAQKFLQPWIFFWPNIFWDLETSNQSKKTSNKDLIKARKVKACTELSTAQPQLVDVVILPNDIFVSNPTTIEVVLF